MEETMSWRLVELSIYPVRSPHSRALEAEQGCAFREILLLRCSYVDWGGMRGSDAWSLERRASATCFEAP